MSVEARLQQVLAIHFDPKWGSAYWLERAKTLDFNPLTDVKTVDALARFGPMDMSALAARAVTDFVPRRYHQRLDWFVTTETGGTTGPPKRTAYREDEFDEAFVTPFLAAAELMAFPRDCNWLFVGPSGPHIIGKAARACAVAMGSIDPFTVDFDPRWVRKLVAGSLARERYVAHVLEQALGVLRTQDIGVLFATPPMLAAMGNALEAPLRDRVRGIHLGGLPGDGEFWRRLHEEWYPKAVTLSGYGNSLAGVCPEVHATPGAAPEYFPHGDRLVVRACAEGESSRGAVMFHRLDESAFFPNVMERDEGESIDPPDRAVAQGFRGTGLRDPRPPARAPEAEQAGLY